MNVSPGLTAEPGCPLALHWVAPISESSMMQGHVICSKSKGLERVELCEPFVGPAVPRSPGVVGPSSCLLGRLPAFLY